MDGRRAELLFYNVFIIFFCDIQVRSKTDCSTARAKTSRFENQGTGTRRGGNGRRW
jgi:hypothetical protein